MYCSFFHWCSTYTVLISCCGTYLLILPQIDITHVTLGFFKAFFYFHFLRCKTTVSSTLIWYWYWIWPRSTPPNTPQRHRNTERERERNSRILDSPEQRRVPGQHLHYGHEHIPFRLNIPHHAAQPQQQQLGDDPFQMIHHNGQELQLSQGMANQVADLPPMPRYMPRQVHFSL